MNDRLERLIKDIDAAYKSTTPPIPRVRELLHGFCYDESLEDAEIYYMEHRRLLEIKNRKRKERLSE